MLDTFYPRPREVNVSSWKKCAVLEHLTAGYTGYELLTPGSAKFLILYEISATRPGAMRKGQAGRYRARDSVPLDFSAQQQLRQFPIYLRSKERSLWIGCSMLHRSMRGRSADSAVPHPKDNL